MQKVTLEPLIDFINSADIVLRMQNALTFAAMFYTEFNKNWTKKNLLIMLADELSRCGKFVTTDSEKFTTSKLEPPTKNMKVAT